MVVKKNSSTKKEKTGPSENNTGSFFRGVITSAFTFVFMVFLLTLFTLTASDMNFVSIVNTYFSKSEIDIKNDNYPIRIFKSFKNMNHDIFTLLFNHLNKYMVKDIQFDKHENWIDIIATGFRVLLKYFSIYGILFLALLLILITPLLFIYLSFKQVGFMLRDLLFFVLFFFLSGFTIIPMLIIVPAILFFQILFDKTKSKSLHSIFINNMFTFTSLFIFSIAISIIGNASTNFINDWQNLPYYYSQATGFIMILYAIYYAFTSMKFIKKS